MSTLPHPSTIQPQAVVITDDYTEGAVIDHAGNLYFSHGEIITRVNTDGSVEEWARTGAPNGHKILPNGEHLVCDGSQHAMLHLDKDGKLLGYAAVGKVGDLEIRCPNDVSLDPAGGFYFTDSVAATGAVIYVAPNGGKKLVAGNIDFANGVALSADRKQLFFAESLQNRILVVDLVEPGVAAGAPRVFCDLPKNQALPGQEYNQPDGIAFDAAGRLWVAHYGMKSLHVLSPEGELIYTYDGANQLTSNVCFAGPNLDFVYTTGSSLGGSPGGVFRLDVNVPGLKLLQN